jgi:60S ribosomal subunit assembly/export protein LOC1
MAPRKSSKKSSKTTPSVPSSTSKLSGPGKSRSKSHVPKAKPEVKTKRPNVLTKKKTRTYTAEQLGVPKLNGIIPSGIQKTKGTKKGKVFVDDAESMLAIMGMVHAEKEGEREGKIAKQRQLEEIREAKRVEAERRAQSKKERLDEAKDEIRSNKRRRVNKEKADDKRSTKRVSFG